MFILDLFRLKKKREEPEGELSRPALSRATASLEVRREGLRLVSPSRAPHGKVRCITSHQSQPPLHNQWSRLVYLDCVPFWNTGPLLTRLATSYLCSAEAGKMASAPPDAGRQVSPMYIDINVCVSMHVYVHYYCLHTYIYRYMNTCSAI